MTLTSDNVFDRALISLEGLSTGDCFGEQFFADEGYALEMIESRSTPTPPSGYAWSYTDDTNMALSIIGSLHRFGQIDQDWLAQSFAEHFEYTRGYGVGMHRLLGEIQAGKKWQTETKRLFYGEGSYGNGAAMRVAPVGAYFADDFDKVVEQARLSAEVTHAHPEGIAGAIAVAVAAALAWRWAETNRTPDPTSFLTQISPFVPAGEVKTGIEKAIAFPADSSIWRVVRELGNGTNVTAQDTVPFTLWSAAYHLDNYEDALWFTVNGLGDRDTTCAIVGGIVVGYTGEAAIPQDWINYREPLPNWPITSE